MRISASNIVAAFFSAAILAACGGGNNSSTPMSVAPPIAAPQSVGAGTASQREHPRTGASYKLPYTFKGAPNDGGGIMRAIPEDATMLFAGQLQASVTIDARSPALATVHKDVFGANLLTNMNLTKEYGPQYHGAMMKAFRNAHFGMLRSPLAILSDYYLWETNSFSSCVSKKWHLLSRTTFDELMQQVARPLGVDVNITVNYANNSDCTKGGDPNEAAAWVDHANNKMHYGIKYWSIGNEMYYAHNGGTPPPNCCSTVDHNVPPNAPPGAASQIYAKRIATKFYPLMKAEDPTIKIGVDLVVIPGQNVRTNQKVLLWDSTVLTKAKFDFVEVHWYGSRGSELSDSALLTKGVSYFRASFAKLRSELDAAGKRNTPVYAGEWGNPGFNPQEISVVGALYTAMVLGELTKGGVGMAGVWEAFDSTCIPSEPGYYTWQNWTTQSLFEAPGCSYPQPPIGTPFPRANAIQVAQRAFKDGDTVVAPTVTGGADLKPYATKRTSGYGLLLVNINKQHGLATTVTIKNDARSFNADSLAYGRAQYDNSKNGVWTGPVSKSLGTVRRVFRVTLPPWSATAITLTH
jgi:hypothetical protein